MKNFKLLVVSAILSIAVFSCKSQYEALLASNDADLKYEAAFKLFNEGKYQKAAQLFESLVLLSSGDEREDTVQFYWGLSNYRYKDYYTAETNFAKFANSFPRSPFAADARFLRLDCLYRSTLNYELDQTPTYAALEAIARYMKDYPDNPHVEVCREMARELNARLDRKAYENARLYYRMEDYKASRVAFRNILKDDSENIYREDILYYIAMSSYNYAHLSVRAKQKERYLTFVDDYLNFIGEIPESPYRRELDVMYRRSQRALGKYSGSEDELRTKEKEFAKERKQILKMQEERSRKDKDKVNKLKNEQISKDRQEKNAMIDVKVKSKRDTVSTKTGLKGFFSRIFKK